MRQQTRPLSKADWIRWFWRWDGMAQRKVRMQLNKETKRSKETCFRRLLCFRGQHLLRQTLLGSLTSLALDIWHLLEPLHLCYSLLRFYQSQIKKEQESLFSDPWNGQKQRYLAFHSFDQKLAETRWKRGYVYGSPKNEPGPSPPGPFFQSSQAGGRRGSHQPEIADWLLVTPQNLWLLPHCLRSKFKQNTNTTTPTNANTSAKRSKNINRNTTLNWLLVPPHCASFIITANSKSSETLAHIYVIRFPCDESLCLPLYYLWYKYNWSFGKWFDFFYRCWSTFFYLPKLFFSYSLTVAKSSYQLHKNVINGCGQLIIHAFPGPFLPRSAELGNIHAEQSLDDIISTMAPVNGPITHYAPPYLNSCWDEVRSISPINMFQISQLVLRDLVINSNVSLPWIFQSSGQTIPCSIRDNVGSGSYKMDWIFLIHHS